MAWGVVKKVIDGDTIELSGGQRVRIADLRAAEFNAPGGRSAKRRLQRVAPPGTVVGLSDPVARSYGRLVRYVTVDGEPLEEIL